MNEIYPWLMDTWQRLQAQRQQGRLAHGLLFSGPPGVGKQALAEAFAQACLCQQPLADARACGQCQACRWLQAGTHPDYVSLQPLEGKQQIVIDQVRDLCAALALKSHAGGYQVALLRPADALNQAAANSLLKTLEEPSDNTLLILITERPARLPATLRSRCQQLAFPSPTAPQAEGWLSQQGVEGNPALLVRLCEGAPLRALALAQDPSCAQRAHWLGQLGAIVRGELSPVSVAAEWSALPNLPGLAWLNSFTMDLVRLHANADEFVRNIDLVDVLKSFLQHQTGAVLHQRLERIWHAQRMVMYSSVNRQLLMEDLLIDWSPQRNV